MTAPSASEVTQLLLAWSDGDQSALKKLAPLVHQELHRLAKIYMSRERPGHTLQTTALPHGHTRVEFGQGVALSRT